MKHVGTLASSRNDFQGVYQCERCHCVRIDESLNSYSDANFFENVIPKMQCAFCDDLDADSQYHTALDTLAWMNCQQHTSSTLPDPGLRRYHTPSPEDRYTFPSFQRIYRDKTDWKYVSVETEIDGMDIDFHHRGISICFADKPAGPPADMNIATLMGTFTAMFLMDMRDYIDGRGTRIWLEDARPGDTVRYFSRYDVTPRGGVLSTGRDANKGCLVVRPKDSIDRTARRVVPVIDDLRQPQPGIYGLHVYAREK